MTEGSRYQPPAEQDFPLVPFIKQPASPGRKRKVRNQQEAGRGEARREQTLRGEALPHRAVSAPSGHRRGAQAQPLPHRELPNRQRKKPPWRKEPRL